MIIQRSSVLCSSNPISLSNSQRQTAPFRDRLSVSSLSACSRVGLLPSTCRRNYRCAISPLHSTATQEIVETTENEPVSLGTRSNFIETGYISNSHGLQGEVSIKPNTDFPELRFAKPGRRWLRQQISGREKIQEVELLEGRAHPGQKCWILRFEGIDSVDKAKLLVGSTLLVREEDRPELEEGEFYTRDLVGMRVVLQETGELVGTVMNVFDSGASDLLHVMLNSSAKPKDQSRMSKPGVPAESGPLVWIPFVEAIVPVVDMNTREMQITPPEGLLELNVRSDERSKKERRQLEWAERKKFQRRVIAAKRKLCELEQQHVFHGFRFGGKPDGRLLAEQIVGVNSKLLQQALLNIDTRSKRWDINKLLNATKNKLLISTEKISEECPTPCAAGEKLGATFNLQEQGLSLVSKGKVAIVLVVNDSEREESAGSTEASPFPRLQTILGDGQSFVKVEDRATVPLILVCPAYKIKDLETLFSDNDHFAFDSKKVWFLEEETLPVVDSLPEEQNRPKILMKSPWEILQSPVGSGGVISLLSSSNIPQNLSEMGVEYIQTCSTSQRYLGGNLLLLGFVNSVRADIGIQISNDSEDFAGTFNMIFSMNIMKKLTNQINKLQFYAMPNTNSHVELVNKEWVDVIPSSPNSYVLCSSIYSCLNACRSDKVCVMEITE